MVIVANGSAVCIGKYYNNNIIRYEEMSEEDKIFAKNTGFNCDATQEQINLLNDIVL